MLTRWNRDPSFLAQAFARTTRTTPNAVPERAKFYCIWFNSPLLTVMHFRATVSKHLADVLESRDVLDFSSGWGDRFSGFLASQVVETITLIDPRPGSLQCCKQQYDFVTRYTDVRKKVRYVQKGAEVAMADPRIFSANSMDLILSSPPYFDLEHYGETPEEAKGQIRLKAKNNDDYLDLFLDPVIKHAHRILRKGGILALNVDDNEKRNVRICGPALSIAKRHGFTLFGTAGLRKGKGFGSGITLGDAAKAEPIYLFRK